MGKTMIPPLISGQIRLLTLELLALEWWKFYTFELEYPLRPIGVTCPWMTKILHFRTWIFLEANWPILNQILCVASVGMGKGCIMFWGRLNQNPGVRGNRKPPLTYNGENGVSTFSWLLLIQFFLYLQVMRTCIKSWTFSNFGQIGPLRS